MSKAIEMSIRNVHRASMEAEVIPRFEKATREMFRQISETFTQGTQDYMKRLEWFVLVAFSHDPSLDLNYNSQHG